MLLIPVHTPVVEPWYLMSVLIPVMQYILIHDSAATKEQHRYLHLA